MSKTKRIQIRIKPDGQYVVETKEGFSGSACTEQTQDLEQTIGGGVVEANVKPEFYHSDDDGKQFIVV